MILGGHQPEIIQWEELLNLLEGQTGYLPRPKNMLSSDLYVARHKSDVKVSVFGVIWSAFSRIQTEYREIRSISLHSVRMPENADYNNSEYRYFLRSENKHHASICHWKRASQIYRKIQ